MTTRLITVIAMVLVVAGCGRVAESRFNPFNWFGSSQEEQTSLIPSDANYRAPVDSSVQIAELTGMRVDRMPGGAIVTAEGVAPTQGFWDPSLVEAEAEEGGAIVLDFRVERPFRRHPAGGVPTRTVSAGVFLSDIKLRGVNRIIVRGATTQRVSRR